LDDVVQDEINQLQTGILQDISHEILNQNNTITFGGERAHQIQYITDIMGLNTFNVDTMAIHNGKLYNIHFNTGELMVPETLPDMNTVVKTFRFMNGSIDSNSNSTEQILPNNTQTFSSTENTTIPQSISQINQTSVYSGNDVKNESLTSAPSNSDRINDYTNSQREDNYNDSSRDLMDDVEETMRSSGIDFGFD
jgi:hypothetical protein